MAKKEEYHNLKDLQSDELNLEKVIEKIREEAKEEEIPERLKPEHLDEILNSQKKKGRWQGMKKRKYMVAAAWVAVLVGIGVSSVVLIHKKDSAEIGAQTASSAKDGSGNSTISQEASAEEKQVEGYKSASSYEEIYQKLFVETKQSQESLKDVKLIIKSGEFLVITGQSGCGKTTLTRCINKDRKSVV